jgi:hypothetical protein
MPDPTPARIELRLHELNQLFNSMDPSPFYDKDLDEDAEEFIVGWAEELPHDRPLELVVYLAKPPDCAATFGRKDAQRTGNDPQPLVQEAVQNYFAHKMAHARREFSQLMRRGRASLLIGLLFLVACLSLSRLFEASESATFIARESLLIAGWVAMWRPLEIFLYDWWPIRARWRLYRRLSALTARLRVAEH